MGDAEQITEYTIAVDVFGKQEAFRETKDSIVRVEVHRLRKKLLQFYDQEEASHRIRIVIPTGTYAPEFLVCGDPPPAKVTLPLFQSGIQNSNNFRIADRLLGPERSAYLGPAVSRITLSGNRSRVLSGYVGVSLIAIALIAGFFVVPLHNSARQALNTFWAPVFSSSNQILLCIGTLDGGRWPSPGVISGLDDGFLTLKDFHHSESYTVHLDDAETLARFAAVLQANGKSYRTVSQAEATFADLQSNPAILIGLLNNNWTERLLGKLRFTVDRRGADKILIRDRDNPARSDWLTDYSTPLLNVTKDYALVLRVFDPKTEQMVVIAGGISVFGTLAASEFVTTPNEFLKLEPFAPRDWKRKNMEVVLSTDVIRGRSGHPKVEAATFW